MKGPVTAIILAAGYSSRMGAFKPLLPFRGTTVLENAIRLFRAAGLHDIRVAVGHRSEELLPLLKHLQVRPVLNERYQEGMFSSVVAAAESLEAEVDAFFLLPVDIPLVRRETVELLIRAYRSGADGLLYPAFHGTRGHPPLISSSYRTHILSWNGNGGLNGLLTQYEGDSATIETGDEGILLDMDTRKDYERLQGIVQNMTLPSRHVCEKLLLERFAADSPVVGHSREVARVAILLAERLNDSGCHLDLTLIEAAALLHDLAKGEHDHAAAGAAILKRMGYGAVADLVAVHMELPHGSHNAINAADLLFLADKLVKGARIVPLEARFRRQLEKYAHDHLILPNIIRRLESARTLLRLVESRLGTTVGALLKGAPS